MSTATRNDDDITSQLYESLSESDNSDLDNIYADITAMAAQIDKEIWSIDTKVEDGQKNTENLQSNVSTVIMPLDNSCSITHLDEICAENDAIREQIDKEIQNIDNNIKPSIELVTNDTKADDGQKNNDNLQSNVSTVTLMASDNSSSVNHLDKISAENDPIREQIESSMGHVTNDITESKDEQKNTENLNMVPENSIEDHPILNEDIDMPEISISQYNLAHNNDNNEDGVNCCCCITL